ncbi:hypothetical protein N7466_008105 [Penicillium verhagenii]|uniref:uncharacterized protein n=1 Tax=Penicillium verhagenii TaxID=1562060 RepID=UPI002545998D|nr:uncharacterized protein N7466_008105 [Penicillium verhagenii]KAJ5923918.1 hypothetical protein N7466_008105 [Penicillium verhagenii]
MLSHLVTAAKGLFTRSESQQNFEDPAGAPATTTSEMVTSTRRSTASAKDTPKEPKVALKQGKRKAPTDKQSTKRQKRSSLEAAAESDDEETGSSNTEEKKSAESSEPKGHFRFGSEEPAFPETQPEQIEAPNDDEDDDSSDDDDDDAPETIDNSAQLLQMKEKAKKQEQAKQLEEQLKKDKRRKLDERRKLQAKSKAKEAPPSDDLLSESTATLQGSNTQDARRSALPALLPDDILNAEPVARALTPPTEESFAPKKPTKLRFLEKTEKAPKDVQVGDVTIRVLDAPSVKRKASTSLAPKSSKAARNVKDAWLKGKRSVGHVNGLRRTAGGSTGFVRR